MFLIILILFILLFILKSNYQKEQFQHLNEKKYPLKKLYPLSQYIIDKIRRNKLGCHIYRKYIWTKKREDDLNSIYIGEDILLLIRIWQCQKVAVLYLIFCIILVFVILLNFSSSKDRILKEERYILRPSYGEGTTSIDLNAYINDGDEIELYQYNIEVEERKYSEELVLEYFNNFSNEIESAIISNNVSLHEVRSNLLFPKFIPNTRIPLKWSTSNSSIINNQGIINRENLEENQIIEVSVTVKYMKIEVSFLFFVEVMKKDPFEELGIEDRIYQYIEKTLSDDKVKDKVELESEIDGVKVKWEEEKHRKDIIFLMFGLALMIGYLLLDKSQVDLMVKVREKQMIYDYSEIVSKLTMYLRAGMSLSVAWGKIVDGYLNSKESKRYAYEEMLVSYREMRLGESEIKVLEGFGRRIKVPCYLRLASLVSSNIQKGNSSLLNQLEYEVMEAFMERKEIIKRMGEEAGTKLLIPMMIMLVLVLAIIMIPAYLSFQL